MVDMKSPSRSSAEQTALSTPVKKNGRKTKLASDFKPGKYAVLCGRGSKCTKSSGNQRLKQLVHSYLKPYSEASNKVEKTSIVSAIISSVKQLSPEGSFVKFEQGSWWEVEDAFAREKIGCLFRDCLHTQYRSSTKAKLARKKALTDPIMPGEHTMSFGNGISINSSPHSSVENLGMGMVSNNNNSMLGMSNGIFNSMPDPSFSNFNNGNNNFMPQQPHHHQQQQQTQQPQFQQDMSFMPMPDKMQGFKKQEYASLVGNYLGSQNSRPLREDFMSACMPNSMGMKGNNPMLPQSMGMGMNGTRNSLLQTACDILGDDSNDVDESNGMGMEDDFPDDLSDIFEDDQPLFQKQQQQRNQPNTLFSNSESLQAYAL